MTKWGKVLWFFWLVSSDELDWILFRVLGFKADKRRWDSRLKIEHEGGTFDAVAETLCAYLQESFKKTRLAKIHGWELLSSSEHNTPHHIQICLRSASVDVEHTFSVWVYDVEAFLKACNGRGGYNLDEINWMLNRLIATAQEKARNKPI